MLKNRINKLISKLRSRGIDQPLVVVRWNNDPNEAYRPEPGEKVITWAADDQIYTDEDLAALEAAGQTVERIEVEYVDMALQCGGSTEC